MSRELGPYQGDTNRDATYLQRSKICGIRLSKDRINSKRHCREAVLRLGSTHVCLQMIFESDSSALSGNPSLSITTVCVSGWYFIICARAHTKVWWLRKSSRFRLINKITERTHDRVKFFEIRVRALGFGVA